MKKLFFGVLAVLIFIAAASLASQYLPSRNTTTPTPSPASSLQVTFLDVGQADSILIQSDNQNMLIDAGNNADADSVVKSLEDKNVSRIDVLVGTHPHEDHIGGMDAVINQFDIGTIYMPDVTTTTKTFEDVLDAIEKKGLVIDNPVPGQSFTLGSSNCTILAPNSKKYESLNNYSIVIRLQYGSTSFLFTGDAEVKSEEEMLAQNFVLQSDVLKVGHHGSTSSTSDEFLKAVSPKYAVIMVGKDNDYGHPHQETLDKLEAAGIKIYRTDLNGDITFTSDGSTLTVQTEK